MSKVLCACPWHTHFAEHFFHYYKRYSFEFENVDNKIFVSKDEFDLKDMFGEEPVPNPITDEEHYYCNIVSGEEFRKFGIYYIFKQKKFIIYIDGEFHCDYAVDFGEVNLDKVWDGEIRYDEKENHVLEYFKEKFIVIRF